MMPEAPPESTVKTAHVAAFDWGVAEDESAARDQVEAASRLRQEVESRYPDAKLLPSPGGVAILFSGSFSDALDATGYLCSLSLKSPRVGFSSGPIYSHSDISLQETFAGPAVNMAFRLRDHASDGQILLAGAAIDELAATENQLAPIGNRELRPGQFTAVYAIGGEGERREEPLLSQPEIAIRSGIKRKVVLVYKRRTEPDNYVLWKLEQSLRDFGHDVFIDRHLVGGTDWRNEIRQRILDADFLIPLVSLASASSEMMLEEVRIAVRAFQTHGHPRVLPIRVAYEGNLPSELSNYLDPFQYVLWEERGEDHHMVSQVQTALQQNLEAPVKPVIAPVVEVPSITLEAIGGAVPLGSRFYVPRPADEELRKGIDRRDSILLIKAARQMGKTSLLARGCQHAREHGARVAVTDLQRFEPNAFESLDSMLMALAFSLADSVDAEVLPDAFWKPHRGSKSNFESYLRKHIIADGGHLVWALDEVDRLQGRDFTGELFGLLRSFHNARAFEPDGHFHRLTMIFSYATEASDFIADMDQSPFNVGTPIPLSDFSASEVGQLHEAYGTPLTSERDLQDLIQLLGGHPYLLRRALTSIVIGPMTLAEFSRQALLDDGPLGDHLKRLLFILTQDQPLLSAMHEILDIGRSSARTQFYRLRSAGIVGGESPSTCGPRCALYGQYLAAYLPR